MNLFLISSWIEQKTDALEFIALTLSQILMVPALFIVRQVLAKTITRCACKIKSSPLIILQSPLMKTASLPKKYRLTKENMLKMRIKSSWKIWKKEVDLSRKMFIGTTILSAGEVTLLLSIRLSQLGSLESLNSKTIWSKIIRKLTGFLKSFKMASFIIGWAMPKIGVFQEIGSGETLFLFGSLTTDKK